MNKKIYIFIALAALAITACSNEEITPGGENSTGEARFSATIDGPVTRAVDQAWEQSDEIGISVKTGDVTYTNVRYFTPDTDGNFGPRNAADKIYYQDEKKVSFTAYYPWNDLNGGNTISADTRNQKLQNTFDFLWAQADGQKALNNGMVNFTFEHKMAKVVLTIKQGADVSFDEVREAILGLDGFFHVSTFAVTTGNTDKVNMEEMSQDWTFSHNTENENYNALFVDNTDETRSYTLIVFPQEFGETLTFSATLKDRQTFVAALDFTEANEDAGDTAPKNEWVAGRQYNIGIKLNKSGISVTGCTIADWNPANIDKDFDAN